MTIKKVSDKMAKRRYKKKTNILVTILILLIIIIGNYYKEDIINTLNKAYSSASPSYIINEIPEYTNKPYVIINNNQPNFDEKVFTTKSFEKYSELDLLGRCGTAYANIGKDLMPTEQRGAIGMVKPSGWHTIKYNHISGKYLYNRCHLIGFQLTGENANTKNLITCTRYMNTVGMLEFENKVAEYIKKTNNHVLYRVTPIFKDNNLLASGVSMEAKSVEDNGKGICFNVFVYNVQDGITIDYKTGESKLTEENRN